MIARVATIEGGDPSRSGEVEGYVRANVLPEMRATPGLKRVMTLLDRGNRKVLAISFWDSDEEMRSAAHPAGVLLSTTFLRESVADF